MFTYVEVEIHWKPPTAGHRVGKTWYTNGCEEREERPLRVQLLERSGYVGSPPICLEKKCPQTGRTNIPQVAQGAAVKCGSPLNQDQLPQYHQIKARLIVCLVEDFCFVLFFVKSKELEEEALIILGFSPTVNGIWDQI